jgi:hypothetical protein
MYDEMFGDVVEEINRKGNSEEQPKTEYQILREEIALLNARIDDLVKGGK